ncbi:MAG: monovalent cation:proton antiporter-2 (CPA2) family protein [Pseudomonadota bacterium]
MSALIAVPLFKRIGLGAVLGYIAAGVIVGPWGINRFHDVEHLLHFAEIGVVLLLFLIGLELQPSRLWALRRPIFLLGGAQLSVTAVCVTLAVIALGIATKSAVIIGLSLALSSTAFALQLMAERNELNTRWGRTGFAILLFQDLAVVPILATIPLLGTAPLNFSIQGATIAFITLVVVISGGRYFLAFLLKIAALTELRELLTATALLTVLGMGLLLQISGFSMALGAFLAGVLLADSEFRHELEADIEPFKGLLLGLFFMAVGMSLNFQVIVETPIPVFVGAFSLVLVKSGILYGLGRFHGLDPAFARRLGVSLSQGGEFAFVVMGVAIASAAIGRNHADLVTVVVTVSMVITPILLFGIERATGRKTPNPVYDTVAEDTGHVVIAGFGRFGQIVARILSGKGVKFVALEINPSQVDFVRNHGNQVYFGDAARLDLLRSAGISEAALFVNAVDDPEQSLHITEIVRDEFPELPIFARSRNRKHAYQLLDLGVDYVTRDTFHSALSLSTDVLCGLGFNRSRAEEIVDLFRLHDEGRLLAHRDSHTDEERMQDLAKQDAAMLEELFQQDESKNSN